MVWKSLIKLLLTSAAYWGVAQAASRPGVNGRTVKTWLIGAGLVFGSVLIGTFGIVILVMALFFELANYEQLVMPAVITSVVSLLLAAAVMIEGLRKLRPRR